MNSKKFKIGIVANEFFCAEYPPLGGFGLTVKTISEFFQARPELETEVVALMPSYSGSGPAPERLHNTKVISMPKQGPLHSPGEWLKYTKEMRANKPDLLIAIDYYPNYLRRLMLFPRTPCIYMALDPHTDELWEKILTLHDTEYPCEYSRTILGRNSKYDKTKFYSKLFGRKLICTVPEPWLVQRAREGFNLHKEHFETFINVIETPESEIKKSEKPYVIFLARLATVKRPWLFCELAKRMPDIDFHIMGDFEPHRHVENHIPKPGEIPNLHFEGNVTGERKFKMIGEAWALINTSIHEGMPNSVLECMAYKTPVISALDFGDTVHEYGFYVGEHLGDGLQSIPKFEEAIRKVTNDTELRDKLGQNGHDFVKRLYSNEVFFDQFKTICSQICPSLEKEWIRLESQNKQNPELSRTH